MRQHVAHDAQAFGLAQARPGGDLGQGAAAAEADAGGGAADADAGRAGDEFCWGVRGHGLPTIMARALAAMLAGETGSETDTYADGDEIGRGAAGVGVMEARFDEDVSGRLAVEVAVQAPFVT
jgi:hypothetical protein